MRFYLLVILLCFPSSAFADFYNFTLDWDNMNQSSPANIGNIVLKPISNVTRSGTQFRSNEARIKFYGANICYDANTPYKNDTNAINSSTIIIDNTDTKNCTFVG